VASTNISVGRTLFKKGFATAHPAARTQQPTPIAKETKAVRALWNGPIDAVITSAFDIIEKTLAQDAISHNALEGKEHDHEQEYEVGPEQLMLR
jgi:hypothetical protein